MLGENLAGEARAVLWASNCPSGIPFSFLIFLIFFSSLHGNLLYCPDSFAFYFSLYPVEFPFHGCITVIFHIPIYMHTLFNMDEKKHFKGGSRRGAQGARSPPYFGKKINK